MMRKNYVYAAALLLLSLLLWLGLTLYTDYRPREYRNGTFVELPEENRSERIRKA